MALPTFELPTEDITIGGHTITVRGLSRAEALKLSEAISGLDDVVEQEIHMLAVAFGQAVDDTRDWYHNTPSHVVETILKAVSRLSGMDDLGKGPNED